MGSQYYVDTTNDSLDAADKASFGSLEERFSLARAQVTATLAVAASIHDLISHLRGVTPCRPFDDKENKPQ
jgi:hypothetical protein